MTSEPTVAACDVVASSSSAPVSPAVVADRLWTNLLKVLADIVISSLSPILQDSGAALRGHRAGTQELAGRETFLGFQTSPRSCLAPTRRVRRCQESERWTMLCPPFPLSVDVVLCSSSREARGRRPHTLSASCRGCLGPVLQLKAARLRGG